MSRLNECGAAGVTRCSKLVIPESWNPDIGRAAQGVLCPVAGGLSNTVPGKIDTMRISCEFCRRAGSAPLHRVQLGVKTGNGSPVNKPVQKKDERR
jgi:hypothetical protein|tara:strand:- start:609 stop:896 length:288 start_codon:yes stop_codon:yes gene_type:complete